MRCTEKASPELKSSSQKGIETENYVADFLIEKKFKLLKQRFRTPFGEIDLLLESPRKNLVMLEVKSLSNWDRILYRLTPKQRQRLHRTRAYIESKYSRPVILKIAYLAPGKKLVFLDT